MSTDYSAVCRTCRRSIHVGQNMAGRWSFGFASHDEAGRLAVGAWIEAHISPPQIDAHALVRPHDVGLVFSDDVPAEFERDEY